MSIPVSDFAARTGRMTQRLIELVEMESPTYAKPELDRLGRRLADEARRLGAQVEIHPQTSAGDHITARWMPKNGADVLAPLVILCHFDTVHPLGMLKRMPARVHDDRVYGPGAVDMKAGIATVLEAVEALREADAMPLRPLTLLLTSDEETGSLTSRPLIEALCKDAALVLCMEPGLPGGALKSWRKGVGRYELNVYGRAAHAGGEHSQGRNAIEELAHQIIRIQGLTDYERGVTLNVGWISGGTTSNVVPDHAYAVIDLRVTSMEEAQRVEQALNDLIPALKDTRLEMSGELNRPPMPKDALMQDTLARAREIAAGLGMTLRDGGTGGGSDANFAAALGVPVLDGLGPCGEGQHSEREFAFISSFAERAALLAALLNQW